MPVSPFRRPAEGGEPDEPGHGESGPTHGRQKRKDRQRKRQLFMELREELQLSGDIPTTPEGAIRDERVDPDTQSSQPLSHMIADALRKGWEVDEEKKPGLIAELVRIVLDPNASEKSKIGAFSALRMADQAQWERDNPTMKDRTPASVNINVVCVGEAEVSEPESGSTIRVGTPHQQLPGR